MATTTEAPKKKESSIGAIIGWGGLVLFSLGFIWLIAGQLDDSWAKREDEAKVVARESKPADSDTSLQDLTKEFSIKAKQRGDQFYVGEFTWSARQKDGPEYEVTLLWTEGNARRLGMWRVNLQTKEVSPQNDDARNLPKRAKSGGAEG